MLRLNRWARSIPCCVTGVTGPLGRDAREGSESREPWFWTVEADDREVVYKAQRGRTPAAIATVFDTVADMEATPVGQVVVCDQGDARVVVLHPSGSVAINLQSDRMRDPRDVGVDDYGRIYVYDHGSRRILILSE